MQATARPMGHDANQKQKRATIACTACRQSKTKCSGDEPCVNCRRKSLACQFSEENNKILVSERYLRDLQKQAYKWQRATGTKRSRDEAFGLDVSLGDENIENEASAVAKFSRLDGATPSNTTDLSFNIWTSPFTLPTTIMDTHHEQRKWIWLSPASPWSLTARLIVMMTEKLEPESLNDSPRFYLDGDIYPFAWSQAKSPGPLDTSGLPSLDYALHLFHVVRFHLGQAYRFFDDEADFVSRMHDFYKSPPDGKTAESGFWFVQFLMILALGNAFLSRPRHQKDPPGSKYFTRAMAAMPNYTSTGQDSLVAIEALALVGLYLYSIDHREAAHVHVGHAIRIAQLEGMHTQLPEEALGASTVARCRNLWWSLYIMDRHISPSLGLPMTTKDSDITTLINPPTSTLRDVTFNLQVRITRMSSFIVGTIYKTEKTQAGKFLEITRNILETMAIYAEEIENMMNVNFDGGRDNVPQEARHTILLYHQCVIVATRPLLLSVLKERLDKLGRGEENWQKFLVLPRSLISIGIKSAEKTLQIINDETGMLETFLSSDLEMTYSAAVHLTMAGTHFPSGTDTDAYSKTAHTTLSELVLAGNRIAEARKKELGRIEALFQQLARRVEQEGLQVLTLADPDPVDVPPVNILNEGSTERAPLPEPGLPFPVDSGTTDNFDFFDSIGISSHEFLAIVDQIGNPGLLHGGSDEMRNWMGGDILGAR